MAVTQVTQRAEPQRAVGPRDWREWMSDQEPKAQMAMGRFGEQGPFQAEK